MNVRFNSTERAAFDLILRRAKEGGAAPSNADIADACGIESVGAASGIVARLEALGLISVEPVDRNRRAITIRASGERLISEPRRRGPGRPKATAPRSAGADAPRQSHPGRAPRLRPLNLAGPGMRFKACQWIEPEPIDAIGPPCGDPVVEGRPYCATHLARAYRPIVAKLKGEKETRHEIP